jgi:hypothetical protein
MLLRDRGDAGVILLETPESPSDATERVTWYRAEDVPRLATHFVQPEPGYTLPSFADYIASAFEAQTEHVGPDDMRYDPSTDQ